VAFVSEATGHGDIYLQRVNGQNAINLTPDSEAAECTPTFSPDGEQIAFRSERDGGGVFVMGATGESVRRVADRGYNPSWSPDGRHLVVSTEMIEEPMNREATAELWVIDVTTGAERRLYGGDAVQPAWSPDGRRIAFWGLFDRSGQRDLATIDAEGQEEPALVTRDAPVDWNPVWSPDGRALYFLSDRGGTMDVWQVAVDPATGRAGGEPRRVGAPAEDVAWLTGASGLQTMAYVSRSTVHALDTLGVDPDRLRLAGERRTVLRGSLPVGYIHPSPDGTRIALTTEGTREDLYVLGVEDKELRRLTDDPFRDRGPQWSPDGSEIAFYSDRSGTYQIWSIRPDGSGLRQLTEVADRAWYPFWSPDGQRITFPGDGARTCTITVQETPASSAECLPGLAEDRSFFTLDWSPDGQWLVGNEALVTGNSLPTLLLWSFDSGEYRPLATRGRTARWMPDSRHLLVLDEGGHLVVVDRTGEQARDLGPLEAREQRPLDQRMALSRDGRTLVVQSGSVEANVWLLSPEGDDAEGP
jgi:Tol biopolymer transport system component